MRDDDWVEEMLEAGRILRPIRSPRHMCHGCGDWHRFLRRFGEKRLCSFCYRKAGDRVMINEDVRGYARRNAE